MNIERPLELLQVLIAMGGEGVEEARLIDALWPDSEGDLAMQSFRTTISRLRRLLGQESALVTGGGRLRLDRRYVWTDLWALEHCIERGLAAAASGDKLKTEGAADLQKVLDHYPGEFLPDCGYPWAMPMRERIRTRYLNAILDIGACLERSGERLRAVRYYLKGLELDSLAEGLYQGLIVCYGELGLGAEAFRIYGQSDWRLPTVKELSTLVNADVFIPAINTAYFPQTQSSVYWSSITYAGNTGNACNMNFHDGGVVNDDKSNSHYVRAVRGGRSAGQLVDNGDGTVTDTATGLMWQQAEAGAMTWEAALAYCENLDLAGHDDWRLPNRNELQSIVGYEMYDPAIDTTVFPGAASFEYLSSTTYADNTGYAWYVSFNSGNLYGWFKSSSNHVRAVRGGQ